MPSIAVETAVETSERQRTVYRWLARYDRLRLESLEDRSSRPARRRRPTWTSAQLAAVKAIRERYPRWGKDKLVILLRRQGAADV